MRVFLRERRSITESDIKVNIFTTLWACFVVDGFLIRNIADTRESLLLQ